MELQRWIILAVIAAFLAAAPGAQAGFLMIVDSKGNITFSDSYPSKKTNGVVVKYFSTNTKQKLTRPMSYNFSKEYDSIIYSAAVKHSLDPMLIKSVIKVESDFKRTTVSSKGARGLMQLMPDTARDMNVRNVFDAEENIHGGSRYLRLMLNKFNQNTKLALAAYNAGPTAVESYGGVPPYQETERYIWKVMNAYSFLSGQARPTLPKTVQAVKKSKPAPVYKAVSINGALVYSDRPLSSPGAVAAD